MGALRSPTPERSTDPLPDWCELLITIFSGTTSPYRNTPAPWERVGLELHKALSVGLDDEGRVRLARAAGGLKRAKTQRSRRDRVVKAVEKIRGGRVSRSWAEAARLYLQAHDRSWQAGPEDERRRKVDALIRRLRRAKNRGR